MSLYNFFRSVFGFPRDGNSNRRNEFRNPIWNLDDDDDDDDDFRAPPRSPFGFHVDSDPFEMSRFFEQQMEEIMRGFQAFGFGFGPGMFGAGRGPLPLEPPAEDGTLPKRPSGGSLRDSFLKPGYEGRSSGSSPDCTCQDQDLDEHVRAGDLIALLRPSPAGPALPHSDGSFFSRSVGRFVTSSTVRLPHGGVEMTHTSRDGQGNVEKTVTRTLGDQSYSVTTHHNASGQVQREEKFINMGEGDLAHFEKRWGSKL